jgi:5'-3' exonuclease
MPVSAKQYLFAKILMGDDSDNINQVFPRCGYQTAMKYVLNTDYLKEKLQGDAAAKKQFAINNKIINFENIPQDLQQLIITESEKLLEGGPLPF